VHIVLALLQPRALGGLQEPGHGRLGREQHAQDDAVNDCLRGGAPALSALVAGSASQAGV